MLWKYAVVRIEPLYQVENWYRDTTPGLLLALEAIEHRAADQVDAAHHLRVDVGVERVGKRRHEHPRRRPSRLVLVVHDLRQPVLVQQRVDDAGLGLRLHVGVAVVVVADVLLVEPRHRAVLVRRAARACGTSRRPGSCRPGSPSAAARESRCRGSPASRPTRRWRRDAPARRRAAPSRPRWRAARCRSRRRPCLRAPARAAPSALTPRTYASRC